MFFGNASRFFEEMIANWTDSAVFRSFPGIPACPVNPVYHGNAAKTHWSQLAHSYNGDDPARRRGHNPFRYTTMSSPGA